MLIILAVGVTGAEGDGDGAGPGTLTPLGLGLIKTPRSYGFPLIQYVPTVCVKSPPTLPVRSAPWRLAPMRLAWVRSAPMRLAL